MSAPTYWQGEKPDSAYEAWKAGWKPPVVPLRVRRGMVLVEFGPIGHRGEIWHPDNGASYNAKVIYDSTGELPPGTEIATEGERAVNFPWEDRKLSLISKSDILLEVLD